MFWNGNSDSSVKSRSIPPQITQLQIIRTVWFSSVFCYFSIIWNLINDWYSIVYLLRVDQESCVSLLCS